MLREFEHMRETLSDTTKDELTALFNSLRDDDDDELGRVARKMLYSAVENFNAERADQLEADRAVDAKIESFLLREKFFNAL